MAEMKIHRTVKISAPVFLLAYFSFSQAQSPVTLPNGVAAVVNSEAITMMEILRQTQPEEDDLRAQRDAGKITAEEWKKKTGCQAKNCLGVPY